MRLLIMGPQGVGKGTQAALLERALRHPRDLHRRHLPLQHQEQDRARPRSAQVHRQGRACAGRADQQDRQGPSGHGRRQERLDSRWLPAQRLPGQGSRRHAGRAGTPLDKVVALDADHDVLMQRMKSAPKSKAAPTTPPRPSPSVWTRTPRKPLRCSTRTRAAASWSPLMASATSTPFRPTSSPR